MEVKKIMDLDRMKEFLQNYLDTVVLPRSNSKREEPISLTVKSILKGSYQPPIIHVFIDVEPHWTTKMSLSEIVKDISDFFKVFSINFKVTVHWNKTPKLKTPMEL